MQSASLLSYWGKQLNFEAILTWIWGEEQLRLEGVVQIHLIVSSGVYKLDLEAGFCKSWINEGCSLMLT